MNMIVGIAGQIVSQIISWLITKGYSKKNTKEILTGVEEIIKAPIGNLEKAINELKESLEKILEKTVEPTLQKSSPEQQKQIHNEIKEFSTTLSHIATGIINIGGTAQTSYTTAGPPMTKTVITEEKRSLSDGLEDFYKNK